MLQLSETILNTEVNKIIKAEIRHKKEETTNQTQPEKQYSEEEWFTQKPKLSEDDPILVFNDAWQEKSVCAILINFGHKWYDESEGITIADFIIENIKDTLVYFDVELCRQIIEQIMEERKSGHIPPHTWFTAHKDAGVRDFAVNVLSSPYVYASWDKKEMFLQTQKMPEENFINDATNALLRLQLRKSKKVILELQAYFENASPEEVDSEEYVINLKVMQVVQKQRNDIAAKLGTVTI